MERPRLEVADVLRRYGEAYREQHAASLSTAQRRVMSAIELCRTAALGGHLEQCDQCQHQSIAYDFCRNRHCPKCPTTWDATPTASPFPTIAYWISKTARCSSATRTIARTAGRKPCPCPP